MKWPEMIAGVRTHGLPDELVAALHKADAWEKIDEVALLTEVIDAHRDADNRAQHYLGDMEPKPGESPGEYEARMDAADAEFRAAHPEWLCAAARREAGWLERARLLAMVRMGIAAVDETLTHAAEPDFMERVRATQPFVHDATEALTALAEERAALADAAGLYRNPGSRAFRDPGVTDWSGGVLCRAESGVLMCVKPKGHPPPHAAGDYTWTDDDRRWWQRLLRRRV